MKSLNSLRTGREFVHRAEHDPSHPRMRQSGSHVVVSGPHGITVIPNHPGDIHPGLLCKIRKEWLAAGLIVFSGVLLAVGLAF